MQSETETKVFHKRSLTYWNKTSPLRWEEEERDFCGGAKKILSKPRGRLVVAKKAGFRTRTTKSVPQMFFYLGQDTQTFNKHEIVK